MKTFLAKTVTAAAVCTLIFVSSGSAGPSKMFARYGRHIESSDAGPFNGKAKQQQNALAKREQLQVASYPKYKLIDLTLNGQNSGTFGASVQLNDRGEVIAQCRVSASPIQTALTSIALLGTDSCGNLTGWLPTWACSREG